MSLGNGLTFNAQRIGPMNFSGLRQADYSQGFRMPTMPELVPLVYASLGRKNQAAMHVIKTLKNFWLTGNTGILYTPKGMYAQDNPEMVDGKIVMDENTLEDKLGKTQEKGVIFSDDRSIRFTPHGFKRGYLELKSASDLATNSGVMVFSGGEEEAEMLAKASEHYKSKPYFWALAKVTHPETRFASLNSGDFGGRLGVGADGSMADNFRYSFGVKELTQGGSQ